MNSKSTFIKCILSLILLIFLPGFTDADEFKVHYFRAGVHEIEEIRVSDDHVAIKGEGSGITILHVKKGITITGKEPRISGFSLIGNGEGTGIVLKNTYRAIINDVEIQNYSLGLLSICEFGHRQWLHTYRDLYIYEGENGNLRSYNPKIRGVELRYSGEKSSTGGWLQGGGFSNTHTFFGGRIAVPGTPLLIDGPTATKFFGTYIDMPLEPIRITERSAGLQLFGVHLDQSAVAKKKKKPVLILENPKFNRVKIFGQHQGLMRPGLIVDGKGNPVPKKFIYLSPEKY